VKLKHLFVPTRENDYTPHLLQKAAMLLMCGLILLSFVAVNIQTITWLSSDWLVSTVLPAVVVDKTNDERATLAETPLKRNALLDEAARLKAEDMAAGSYFSHYSPSGVSPWHWFDVVDYQYAHAGENLAVHFTDSAAVVDAWMDSPTHRANIVNGVYTEIGVGTAKGEYQGFDTVFVVQLFGTPAAAMQPTVITIASEPVPVVPESAPIAVLPETVPSLPVTETAVLGEATPEELPAAPSLESVPEEIVVIKTVPAQPEMAESLPTTQALSFMATSSGLKPSLAGVEDESLYSRQSGTTPAESLITMPNHVLRFIYMFLGALIATLLLFSIALGMRYHRPWQVVYGVGLLMLMSSLFYLHTMITAEVVVAAEINEYYE
jgi:Cysteine-rich secretory protein family